MHSERRGKQSLGLLQAKRWILASLLLSGLWTCSGLKHDCILSDPDCNPLAAYLLHHFSKGYYVIAGGQVTDGIIYHSTDGISWSNVNVSATGETFADVAYGNGIFVAIVGGGTANYVYYSTDGAYNWSKSATYTAATLNTVIYDNGAFIAAGNGGVVRYSLDNGLTWSDATIPGAWNVFGLAGNGAGTVVAVATGGVGSASSIDKGASWTTQGNPTTALNDLTYGTTAGTTGFFGVAFGAFGNYSTDAASWTQNSTGAVSGTRCVTIGNNVVVAAGNTGEIRYENSHITPAWTTGTTAGTQNFYDILNNSTLFIAVGEADSVYYSVNNGLNWHAGTGITGGNNSLQGIAYGIVNF